jgi:hypothetical protein
MGDAELLERGRRRVDRSERLLRLVLGERTPE